MSRISDRFSQLAQNGQRALIPYLTACFPTPNHTLGLMHALERGGADIIELGVPFSDPIADGPTIQKASTEALTQGATLPKILKLVKEFRSESSGIPIVLFGAYNPFFNYGLEKLAHDAYQSGADALLIPDLPADEADEVEPILKAAGLDLINLVAPTTPADRQRQICDQSSGFIYYISLKGVTGVRSEVQFELGDALKALKSCTELPVVVGFGISTPEHAAKVGALADGVVVGSALIDLISKNADNPDLETTVENYIRGMKAALPQA